MGVATWSGALLDWERELAALKARLAPMFRRRELKAAAGAFFDGLLSMFHARPAGEWRSKRDLGDPAGCDRFSAAASGMKRR